jgi:pyruvate/2-oxoglutarate dehydrogenase complex dihydrolipoamide dehydrogenase (E3) component
MFGKRVALIEKDEHLGGAGINTGTVPSSVRARLFQLPDAGRSLQVRSLRCPPEADARRADRS